MNNHLDRVKESYRVTRRGGQVTLTKARFTLRWILNPFAKYSSSGIMIILKSWNLLFI